MADDRMDTRWWYEFLPTFPTYRQYVPIAEEEWTSTFIIGILQGVGNFSEFIVLTNSLVVSHSIFLYAI